ncbi:hypothetical protein ACFWNG_03500 [Streptomyces sp. NPDC058391]|uniref:hypothetical protein n=1 Tax=Streptomyces sp. NPDC058391 TaxID=3346476 RepID=UPI0036474D00
MDSAQRKRLRQALNDGPLAQPVGSEPSRRPVLRFALDGPPVQKHRVESAVLGDWLKAFQTAVQSVAYALDELRPTNDSGPVPKEIQRATKLYSGPAFASSYGMVLEGTSVQNQEELPVFGNSDGLLDRAINRILDVTDRADSGPGAEDSVLDMTLPLGRRAISHLSELSDVLAATGADVTLTWQSLSTVSRTSRLSSAGADRCRRVLRAAEVEEHRDRLLGTVVGGSKLRGVIEIEVAGQGVVVIRTLKEKVTAFLGAYAERQVAADVHVLTARSPLGREHHSYLLLDLSLHED